MNSIRTANERVLTELRRVQLRLDDVDNAYNYRRGEYRHDQFTRQGARALSNRLNAVERELTIGHNLEASTMLDDMAGLWNEREDWRTGAFASNTARAVERLMGLGS